MEPHILFLCISTLLLSAQAQPTPASGTLQRTTKQQIVATIPPNSEDNSLPFLTSPSGQYTAYLLRRETAPGAGGFGNDFCYIQIQDTTTGTEQSVWESDCAPVSTTNACALVFSDSGLQVYDGSKSEWDTSAESSDNNPLQTVELVDEGDLRIRDDQGELAWKASDEPRVNQNCGAPGSPGLAPARPPFASPIGNGENLPFGRQTGSNSVGNPQDQQQGNGVSQSFGFDTQPLVDNTPYNGGGMKGLEIGSAVWLAVLALLTFVCFFGGAQMV